MFATGQATDVRVVATGAALIALPLAYLGAGLADTWWFAAIAIPVALVALHLSQSLDGLARRLAIGVTVTVALMTVLVFTAAAGRLVVGNIEHPPQFDLQVFWTYARVASQGFDFYDPTQAHALARTLFAADDAFLKEMFFWYPPPTMFMILPFGWLDIEPAVALWYGVHLAALGLSVVLLQRSFFREAGWLGALVAAALVLAIHPTISTIYYGQTNFLVLLLLLLVWVDRERPRAGVWTALAFFVKPFTALVGLFFLIRGRWRTVGAGLATGVALVGASALAFGLPTVLGYLANAPTSRVPSYMYVQDVNQSLLATILRFTLADGSGSPLTDPLFVNFGLVMIVVTVWLLLRRDAVSDEHGLALCIPLGLMLYPATFDHYLVALVIPIGFLWTQRERLPFGYLGVAGLTSVAVATMGYAAGMISFISALFVWLVLAVAGVVTIASRTWLVHEASAGDGRESGPTTLGEPGLRPEVGQGSTR